MFRKVAMILGCLAMIGVFLSPVAAQEEGKKKAVTVKEAMGKVSEKPQVMMKTTKGDLLIELYPDKAPITVENFLHYVKDGFYDGTIFHRVINEFVIQGGGFTPDMVKKNTHDPIKNEADNGLKNKHYTLSMARTPVVDSATSQFFINLRDNASLDHRGKSDREFGYAVFGKVIDGTDVVDEIAKVATGSRGSYKDVPKENIVIEKASVVGEKTEEAKKAD